MRKFKGLIDEYISYKYWCKTYAHALKLVVKHPIKFFDLLMTYPYIYDALKIGFFVKKQTEAYKGYHHKIQQELYLSTVKCIFVMIRNQIEGGDDVYVIDEMVSRDIFNSMNIKTISPDFWGFSMSMCDSNNVIRYFDYMEKLGVPLDVCSLPLAQAGIIINNEVPKNIKAHILTNVPCDDRNVVSQFYERAWPNADRYFIDVPDFCDESDMWSMESAEKSIWGLIDFIEKKEGKQYNWKALKENCERFNYVQKVDLLALDYAKTDYPIITGCTMWLPRLLGYTVGPGEIYAYKAHKKVEKWLNKAYKEKQVAHENYRYRTIVWNCPPNFYTYFMGWLEQCWGVCVLCDLESYVSSELIDTSSNESIVKGLAYKSMQSTMFKHTHGGVHRNVGDMIHLAKEFDVDFIINANQISCRGQAGYTGLFHEEARKNGYKLCWFDQDLMDKRVFSRQDMRNRMNDFMFNVMNAKPLDESLLVIDDENEW